MCSHRRGQSACGFCGCGVADTDTDGDLTADCNDGCPLDANKIAPGICGCGVSDADTDGDLTVDCNVGCPTDATKIAPGQCGCGVADTDTDGDAVADCVDNCPTVVGQQGSPCNDNDSNINTSVKELCDNGGVSSFEHGSSTRTQRDQHSIVLR